MTDHDLIDSLIEACGTQEALAQALTAQSDSFITTKRISNWHQRGIPDGLRWDVARLAVDKSIITNVEMFDFMDGAE